MRYRVAEFAIDPAGYRIEVAGEEVPVEPQVLDVLVHLITHRDRVVSKNELLDAVWGDRFVSESALTSRIKTARRTLGDDGTTQRMIRTVHGRGYQFVHPVVELEAPATRGSVADRLGLGGVPTPPTPLIGREAELADIVDRLSTSRVVTLLGPGGVGKTRLAIAAATRARETFPDGVAFVELDRLGEASEVPDAIADALNLSEEALAGSSAASALGDQRLLLVLDNVEHVLESAGFVASLVASTTGLVVLATSRERLRLSAESVLDVEPFGTDPDDDAIALYRATVHRFGATLADDQQPVAAEICRVVDGLPLAIELAAAATRAVPPRLLLRRLRENLLVLEGDLQDRPARHRTMVAAIASSVDGLSASRRTLLAHLSLFTAPVPVAALTAVHPADPHEILSDLAALVDKSLLRPFDGPDDDAWFSQLRLIREYARQLLVDAGTEDQARRRHAEQVADMLSALEEQRWGPDAPPWVAVINLRYGDVASAHRWARSAGDLDLAARIAAPLYAFWHRMGHHDQARRWIGEALAHRGDRPSATTGLLHLGAGYVVWAASDLAGAGRHWSTALDTWRELDRPRYVAFCLSHLAGLSIDVPDQYDDALAMNAEAVAIARGTGEAALLAQVLNITGELARVQGELDVAGAAYREALEVLDGAGDRQFESVVLSNLAALSATEGDLAEATDRGRAALELAADLGQWTTVAFCITQLGNVEQRRGRDARAARLLGAADAMLRRIGASRHVADRPDYRQALAALGRSLGEQRVRSIMADGAAQSFEDAVADALRVDD